MTQRYYCPQASTDAWVELDGAEAHHLIHVMRAQPGAVIQVFDGRGHEYSATVTRVDRKTAQLQLGPPVAANRELPGELIVAVALPKGDRQRYLMEKLVELGVHRVIPLRTARTVAQPADKRLERAVIEASKQCGRNQLMQLETSVEARALFGRFDSAAVRWLAHPTGRPTGLTEITPHRIRPVIVAIGPEGGWTDDEVESAQGAGWATIGLGRRILRVETAAATLAAYWSLRLESTRQTESEHGLRPT